MIEIVRHERRVEFAMEGLRFMDLKRWGEVEAAFNRAIADPVGPYNPIFQGGKSDVFPIKVFERIVLKQITGDEIQAVTNGALEIRHLARDYIRTNLTFTFATTTDFTLAEKTEKLIRKGCLGQKPLLNPLD